MAEEVQSGSKLTGILDDFDCFKSKQLASSTLFDGANETNKLPDQTTKSSAAYRRQLRGIMRLKSFTLRCQERLINFIENGKKTKIQKRDMARARLILVREEYDEVLGERALLGKCSWPMCDLEIAEKVSKKTTSGARYRLSLAQHAVFDADSDTKFCGDSCASKSLEFRSSLSTEPLYLRPIAKTLLKKDVNDAPVTESLSQKSLSNVTVVRPNESKRPIEHNALCSKQNIDSAQLSSSSPSIGNASNITRNSKNKRVHFADSVSHDELSEFDHDTHDSESSSPKRISQHSSIISDLYNSIAECRSTNVNDPFSNDLSPKEGTSTCLSEHHVDDTVNLLKTKLHFKSHQINDDDATPNDEGDDLYLESNSDIELNASEVPPLTSFQQVMMLCYQLSARILAIKEYNAAFSIADVELQRQRSFMVLLRPHLSRVCEMLQVNVEGPRLVSRILPFLDFGRPVQSGFSDSAWRLLAAILLRSSASILTEPVLPELDTNCYALQQFLAQEDVTMDRFAALVRIFEL